VTNDRFSDAGLGGSGPGALSAWAESDKPEIHPERGQTGPASQSVAREMFHRAERDLPR